MFKTKQQKIIFFTAVGCAVLLVAVTIIGYTPFGYKNTIDYKKLAEQNAREQAAYQKYLDSIQPDPVASKELFQELITEADVKADVEKILDVKQKIAIAEIPESSIVPAKDNTKDSVVSYFTRVAVLTQDFNTKVGDQGAVFFAPGGDAVSAKQASDLTSSLIANLSKTPVPKDAVAFHKASIGTFTNYKELADNAQGYQNQTEDNPWPGVYKNYAVINQEVAKAKGEFSKLDQKYSLSELAPINIADQNLPKEQAAFIKHANAVFGLGDTTIIVGNVPEAIEKAVREALASAFSRFITVYLDKLITAIEKNYKIANFLYYTDAVVRGQYVNDFLNKYVTDPLDRQIATRFIPQFNCGNDNSDLKKVFEAKARTYLGYDPKTVSPSDPQFAQKLARAGDFMAQPEGWELTFKGIADNALSQAQRAAEQELTSNGLKSPRDIVNKQISASLSAIFNSQSAAIVSNLNLGVVNVDKTIGKLVSGILDNLFNKFLFKGAVVLKEQSACVAVPQLQPVIPAGATEYHDPATPPASQTPTTPTQANDEPPVHSAPPIR